jgi:amidase
MAAQDAPLVAQLRAAGAVILGKANLSEFAGVITDQPLPGGGFSAVGGQAINPHGVPVTGGSSAGSAVGVAAGLTMLSVGTETSGSLLSPAAWNSVVAMKPSRGVVDGRGIVPLLRNNDSAGPVARSVTDAALLLGVIGGRNDDYRAALKADALDGVTVGLLNQLVLMAEGNAAPLQTAATTLQMAGARLRPAPLLHTPDWADPLAFLRLLAAGIRHDMMGYVASLGLSVRTLEDLMAYNQAQPQRRIPFGQEQLTRLLSLTGNTTVSE